MGILDRVKSWFGSGAENSAGNLLASILQSGTAPRRGTRELLQAYRTSPWLHVAIHKIATEVSTVPFELYQTKGRPTGQRSVTRKGVVYRPEGDMTEIEAHPLLDLLRDPNPVMSGLVVWYLTQAYLETKGEAVLVVERKGVAGEELWPVPPHWLAEPPSRTQHGFRFSYMGWQRTIAPEDVIWIRHPDLENPYGRGVGNAETAADEIDLDEFATKHLKNWFFNRALPDVFLYVEGLKSEAEAARWEEKLRQKHGGRGKANLVHVAAGKVEVKQLGQTFREQMLPDLRDQSRDFLLQVFSIPPETVGIVENSNRATIDAAFYLLARIVVAPRKAFLCDALTHWARQEYSQPNLFLGFCSPIPEDAEFELKVMTAQPDLFSKNEWRSLAGKPAVEGWDEEFPERAAAPAFGAPQPTPTQGTKPEIETEDEEADPEEEPEAGEKSTRRRSLHPSRV